MPEPLFLSRRADQDPEFTTWRRLHMIPLDDVFLKKFWNSGIERKILGF
jgi:hypothetical protein